MTTFRASVEAFVAATPGLDDADLPAVTTLYAVADELDGGNVSPAMVAQFGLTHRALLKRKAVSEVAVDPVDDLITRARS